MRMIAAWAVHDEKLGLLSATIQAALSTLDREKVRTSPTSWPRRSRTTRSSI
jgi:hypothetical protein